MFFCPYGSALADSHKLKVRKWGGRYVPHRNIAFNRLFVGYHAILPMRDASPPFVLEFESEEPVSTARPLHISHAHDVGKNTGCSHIGAGAIALNEHGVFVVAFGGEQ